VDTLLIMIFLNRIGSFESKEFAKETYDKLKQLVEQINERKNNVL